MFVKIVGFMCKIVKIVNYVAKQIDDATNIFNVTFSGTLSQKTMFVKIQIM